MSWGGSSPSIGRRVNLPDQVMTRSFDGVLLCVGSVDGFVEGLAEGVAEGVEGVFGSEGAFVDLAKEIG